MHGGRSLQLLEAKLIASGSHLKTVVAQREAYYLSSSILWAIHIQTRNPLAWNASKIPKGIKLNWTVQSGPSVYYLLTYKQSWTH